MTDISDKKSFEEFVPDHPGYIMRHLFMDRKNLTEAFVAAAAGISLKTVSDIINGTVDIDDKLARKLGRVFGDMAETLYRLQAQYDFYKVHGKLMPIEQLPRLPK